MTTNVSSVTNHFPKPQDGFTTTTSGPVSSGASTVEFNSTGNYTNGDVFVGIIDPGDANKKQAFTGIIDISGSQVTGVVWTSGTNQSHLSGATVVDYVTATHLQMMTKGILVHADPDGTLKAGAVDNAAVLANNVVTESKIANGAVSADKLNTGANQATVTTTQTTTSTSFTDLATAGPAVTVTVGANGILEITVSRNSSNNAANAFTEMGFTLSGANTLAADDSRARRFQGYAANAEGSSSYTILLTGLNPGSTTVTAKYAVQTGGSGGGTGTFENRRISAKPL